MTGYWSRSTRARWRWVSPYNSNSDLWQVCRYRFFDTPSTKLIANKNVTSIDHPTMKSEMVDVGPSQGQSDMQNLMHGREVKWYKGHYLKLNLILVSSSP